MPFDQERHESAEQRRLAPSLVDKNLLLAAQGLKDHAQAGLNVRPHPG